MNDGVASLDAAPESSVVAVCKTIKILVKTFPNLLSISYLQECSHDASLRTAEGQPWRLSCVRCSFRS